MTDPALANLDWAHALLDVLVGAGVREVVISPGSRSTPLALTAARHASLGTSVVLDERVAAFFALGQALATGRPVALVATSGSATANHHPALVEAAGSGVALITLTADRPPRLLGLGAPQTIDQVGLYGPTAPCLALPVASADPVVRRAMATRVALATAGLAGPLQINVPFDEPLAPAANALAAWLPPSSPLPVVMATMARVADVGPIAARVAAARHPVMVAGPYAGAHGAGPALLAWAAAVGMPVLADVGSGLRHLDPGGAVVISHADLVVRAEAPTADLLVLVGGAPTSKAVGVWAATAASAVALWPDARGRDPLAMAELVAIGDVADAAWRLAAYRESTLTPPDGDPLPPRGEGPKVTHLSPNPLPPRGEGPKVTHPSPNSLPSGGGEGGRRPDGGGQGRGWWQSAEACVARAIAQNTPPIPDEAAAVRAAIAALPAGAHLVLSNSLPIRHADTYMGPGPQGVVPVVLRGANGIDGVTAAALGVARGTAAPTLLVTGDLAFLHDLGGLAAADAVSTPVALLVLDNDGGGIFHHLPIADAVPDFERLFATPQRRNLAHAAACYGLPFAQPESPAAVGEAIAAALTRPGVSVIVFPCDRVATVADHRAFVAGWARPQTSAVPG